MPSDPSRVLREYVLDPLRRELRVAGARVLLVAGAAETAEMTGTAVTFDAAWIELDSVAGVDLRALGREVTRVLKPGARLVCVVRGVRPLPGLVARALAGGGQGADTAVRTREEAGASLSQWRGAFGPAVRWTRARAFGVLVPTGSAWSRLPPLTLAVLASLEHVVCGWPLLRALGERVVHEGVRR